MTIKKILFTIGLLLFSVVKFGVAAPQSRVLSIGGDWNVGGAAFSPDGRFLAAQTYDNAYGDKRRQTFRLFDARNGKPLAAWRLRTLRTFAFSPDSRTLAITNGERQQRRGIGISFAVELRDLRTGTLRRSLVKAGTVNAAFYVLSWSPDGKLVAASSGDGRVIVWNAHTGKKVVDFRAGDSVDALAWSPGRQLLAVSDRRRVQLWDWAKQQRVGVRSNKGGSLAFSPDGKRLLSNDYYRLRVLEVPTLTPQFYLTKANYEMATFSPDGARIAFSLDSDYGKDLVVTDITLKRQLFRFRLRDSQVKALDLSSNHQLRWVSLNGANPNERKTLKLWQMPIR